MPRPVRHKGTVFLLEDEPLILLELQQMLAELDWQVSHFASDVDQASEIAETEEFDVAILDVNLHGRTSLKVAEILHAKKVPLILATGYSTEAIMREYPAATLLVKPYLKSDLERALAVATAEAGSQVRRTA